MKARGTIDADKVLEVAAAAGLDVERLKAEMESPTIQALLERNLDLAQALRITGTPGFVIGDKIVTGARDLKGLQALISEARSGQ
jgi:protein-disulfide isomerase